MAPLFYFLICVCMTSNKVPMGNFFTSSDFLFYLLHRKQRKSPQQNEDSKRLIDLSFSPFLFSKTKITFLLYIHFKNLILDPLCLIVEIQTLVTLVLWKSNSIRQNKENNWIAKCIAQQGHCIATKQVSVYWYKMNEIIMMIGCQQLL